MNQDNETRNAAGCRSMQVLLSRSRDSALPTHEAASLQTHLSVCSECRKAARADRLLSAALQVDPVPAASLPSGVEAAAWIVSRDRERKERNRRGRRWWLMAPAFSGLAASLAAVLLLYPGPARIARTGVATDSLPALVIVDDERTGRQVMVGPLAGAAGSTP